MTARSPQRRFIRTRASLAVLALGASGLTAITVTSGAASADPVDTQLVVSEVSDPGGDNLSAVQLRTVNIDKSANNNKLVDLPTTTDGTNNPFALNGNSNGNGTLTRSVNGSYLMVAGYNHEPSATVPVDPKDQTSTDIHREVARIGADGSTDTSTDLGTGVFNNSNPRSVASTNGNSFYVSGNGGNAGDSPISGVVKVDLGGDANNTKIDTTAQKNVRQIQIADGAMYATSDKGSLFGLGKFDGGVVPTGPTTITRLALTSSKGSGTVTDFTVPNAFAMVDANSTPGVDTAYVVIDNDDVNGVAGEIRKYTLSGSTWSLDGTLPGKFEALTARVGGSGVQLYAVTDTDSENHVVAIEDSNTTGAANFSTPDVISTAPANRAYRGLSFAPTGWAPGVVTSAAPTITSDDGTVGGTLGDANNPHLSLVIDDTDTLDPDQLTVTAKSANAGVIKDTDIAIGTTGKTRDVALTPTARGRSNITFTVEDPEGNKSNLVVGYSASNHPTATTDGHYLYRSADLSTAIPVGGGYVLAGSSDDNNIRLYKAGESGRPESTFKLDDDLGSVNGEPKMDIEASARVGNTIYWVGSESNKSSNGDAQPARDIVFTTTVSDSGADTKLTFDKKYTGLRAKLAAWDGNNGNALGFTSGQLPGAIPDPPAGFNIEGFEFAPGSTTTGYLSFRAPTVGGKAIIVPVTNIDSVLATGADPVFGAAIKLDLGSRSIREIRKNDQDQYLITAGADSDQNDWALYAWNGKPTSQPIFEGLLPDPDDLTTGAWESIVSVPDLTASGPLSVELIADSGTSTFYDNATQGSDEATPIKKSFAGTFVFPNKPYYVVPAAPATVTTTPGNRSIKVDWDAVTGATSYLVSVEEGGTPITGSPFAVATGTTKTFSGLAPSKAYSISVKAINASGPGDATTVTGVHPLLVGAALVTITTFTPATAIKTTYGKDILVKIHVAATAPAPAPVPTGTVTVTVKLGTTLKATLLGTLDSSGNVTVTVPGTLAPGAYTVNAVYAGSAGDGFKTSKVLKTLAVTIAKAPTTTSAPIATVFGPAANRQFTITGTVQATGLSANPVGTIQLLDGTTVVKTIPLKPTLTSGAYSFTTPALTKATHKLKVKYVGNTNFNTSTSLVTTLIVP